MINKKKPFFSIITVVRNGEKSIEKTIKSVANQTFKNFEYIIIDGKSNDQTVDKIKKYKNKINKFVSEKDKGIYDAFNKGLKISNGEFVCVVNCGDKLRKKALEIIFKYLKKYNDLDFIFGSVKKHWGIVHGYRPKKIYYSWGFYSSHSTGFFIRNLSAKKIGLYNLKYKYHADYDYFFRMIVQKKMKGMATKKDEITGDFERGGFSSKSSYRKMFFEELLIRYNNKQNVVLILLIALFKIFKNFKKIIK